MQQGTNQDELVFTSYREYVAQLSPEYAEYQQLNDFFNQVGSRHLSGYPESTESRPREPGSVTTVDSDGRTLHTESICVGHHVTSEARSETINAVRTRPVQSKLRIILVSYFRNAFL